MVLLDPIESVCTRASTQTVGDVQQLTIQEYVYKLAESVRDLYPAVQDDYLFELEASTSHAVADTHRLTSRPP